MVAIRYPRNIEHTALHVIIPSCRTEHQIVWQVSDSIRSRSCDSQHQIKIMWLTASDHVTQSLWLCDPQHQIMWLKASDHVTQSLWSCDSQHQIMWLKASDHVTHSIRSCNPQHQIMWLKASDHVTQHLIMWLTVSDHVTHSIRSCDSQHKITWLIASDHVTNSPDPKERKWQLQASRAGMANILHVTGKKKKNKQ